MHGQDSERISKMEIEGFPTFCTISIVSRHLTFMQLLLRELPHASLISAYRLTVQCSPTGSQGPFNAHADFRSEEVWVSAEVPCTTVRRLSMENENNMQYIRQIVARHTGLRSNGVVYMSLL